MKRKPNILQSTLKYGTFCVPGRYSPGRGTDPKIRDFPGNTGQLATLQNLSRFTGGNEQSSFTPINRPRFLWLQPIRSLMVRSAPPPTYLTTTTWTRVRNIVRFTGRYLILTDEQSTGVSEISSAGKSADSSVVGPYLKTSPFVCLVYCSESSGFTYDTDNGTCFKLVTEPVVLQDANTGCHNLNPHAHLVVIQNAAKQDLVTRFIGENTTSYRQRFA